MKILGIESASLVASVAVVSDGLVTAEYTVDFKKTHSQTLLPMIDEVTRMLELDLLRSMRSRCQAVRDLTRVCASGLLRQRALDLRWRSRWSMFRLWMPWLIIYMEHLHSSARSWMQEEVRSIPDSTIMKRLLRL